MIAAWILKTSLIFLAICSTGEYAEIPNFSPKLTPTEIYLVQQSWRVVEKDLATSGILLYMALFSLYPKDQDLFPFRNIPVQDLPKDEKFVSFATKVMRKFTDLVHNLGNQAVLTDMLHKLGRYHAQVHVPKSTIAHFKESAISVLQQVLGASFTDYLKEVYEKTLNAIIVGISEGYPS